MDAFVRSDIEVTERTRRSSGYRSPRYGYAPLVVTAIYVSVSACLFALGPYSEIDDNDWQVYGYLGLIILAFSIGYFFGLHSQTERVIASVRRFGAPKTDLLLALGGLWLLVYSVLYMSTLNILSISEIVDSVTNPRDAYYAKFDFDEMGYNVSAFQIANIGGIFYYITVPILFLTWRSASRVARVIAVVGLCSYLIYNLGIGTQKGVVDTVVMTVVCLIVVRTARASQSGKAVVSRRTLFVGLICVAILVIFVIYSLGMRTVDASYMMVLPRSRGIADGLSPVIGPDLARGVVVLIAYITQGYYALGLCFHLPWEWSYGIGGLKGLSSLLPQYFGVPDPFYVTYVFRAEGAFGWSSTENWHSIYPWLASDWSFPGLLVLVLLFGIFVSRLWYRILNEADWVDLSMMLCCALIILYSPANNQIFQGRMSCYGVVGLVILYVFRSLSRVNSRGSIT